LCKEKTYLLNLFVILIYCTCVCRCYGPTTLWSRKWYSGWKCANQRSGTIFNLGRPFIHYTHSTIIWMPCRGCHTSCRLQRHSSSNRDSLIDLVVCRKHPLRPPQRHQSHSKGVYSHPVVSLIWQLIKTMVWPISTFLLFMNKGQIRVRIHTYCKF
jgi:hypothetical protein